MSGIRQTLATALTLLREAVVSLRYNWGIAILSLIMAVSLWAFVSDREGETRVGRVPGSVPIEAVNVPPGQAVLSFSESSVSVRARAQEDVFDRLTAQDFVATVDLAEADAQQVTVEVRVEPLEPRAEVIESAPSEVTVRLERVTSRVVPVETRIVSTPPPGFEPGAIEVEPDEVTVTGPERLVSQIDAVEAAVDLADVRTNFEQTVVLEAPDFAGVDIDPGTALVRIEIAQLTQTATLTVRPQITGSPAAGYNATSIEVSPATVVVSGPADVLQALDPSAGVTTAPVSIDGATADIERTVALQLPQGVEAEQSQVTVRVGIAPAEGSFAFSVAPELTNVPGGLVATLDQSSVQVLLAGQLPELRAIEASDIVATVDLSGLGAGTHTVTVNVQTPAGLELVAVQPPEVTVTLQEG